MSTLPPSTPFGGPGLYALYYFGDLPLYQPISGLNLGAEVPIYVGRAQPQGSRKGDGNGSDNRRKGQELFGRLGDHGRSIERVESYAKSHEWSSLRREDFKCRFLVVEPLFISLGEALLIKRFKPVWNLVADGFGNNALGSGRKDQRRSKWDELHQGRAGMKSMPPKGTSASTLEQHIAEHLANLEVPSLDDILAPAPGDDSS